MYFQCYLILNYHNQNYLNKIKLRSIIYCGSGIGAPEIDKPGPVSQPSQDSSEAEPNQFEETVEPIVLLAPDPGMLFLNYHTILKTMY